MPKTFTGCRTCRNRKIKCPSERPECSRCNKAGLECPGYGPIIIWLPPNQEISKAQGMGGMPPPELTWADQDVYDGHCLDQFISELSNIAVTQFERSQSQSAVQGPFAVLSFPRTNLQPARLFPSSPTLSLDLQPSWLQDQESQALFQHYVSVIASRMMPYHDTRNPWKTTYPSMALNEDSLTYLAVRHAILSQAAAHLQHIGHRTKDMSVLAKGHYALSLRSLSTYLSQNSEYEYGAVLASMLSLIMAEVSVSQRVSGGFTTKKGRVQIYGGNSFGWRYHLQNAWHLATKYLPQKPWLFSETAWLTTQSLCMLKLRMDLELWLRSPINVNDRDGNHSEDSVEQPKDLLVLQDLLASVSSRPDVGFTIGVSPRTVQGLSKAVRLIRQANSYGLTSSCRSEVDALTDTLIDLETMYAQDPADLRALHERVFILGIVIFLRRETIDPSPRALLRYTSTLFDCMQAIDGLFCLEQPKDRIRRDSSHVSVWPVFFAAVECFRPQEMRLAQIWLDKLGKCGIGNREDVSKVVHGVWRERRRRCHAPKAAPIAFHGENDEHEASMDESDGMGDIIVPWREVMSPMGMDILLV
ncbi:uncharacterized protein PV06_03466 [Exophiala oligosperma]|uniref:Zn(2)-C6 fungal-type domain-containing protein n=1 Tax=Exophiala oligosperma TaxID=215243 RepID=A0A0D2DRQ6_9EURO|nr:uncharacterized protein PV06_03466 [Exophiala oligosperma]KIW45045.1 hypothetical protein PV06_03466 [Exophiala oligosperma]